MSNQEQALGELFWLSHEGKSLLTTLDSLALENGLDAAATALKASKKFSGVRSDLTRRGLEIIFSRRQAAALGAWASEGLFTYHSLEQASRLEISRRHASRFAGCRHVLEIGTGIGSDTASIAGAAEKVTSIEIVPEISQMAAHNLALQALSNVELLVGDATQLLSTQRLALYDGLWADPARRDRSGKRLYNPEHWSPPLSWVSELGVVGPCGIKISPGADIEPTAGFSREWIGFKDECLEQTLWRGANVRDGTVWLADTDSEWIPPETPMSAAFEMAEGAAGKFILEPQAALIRSGRLEDFFAQRNVALLDEHIAYGLSAAEVPDSPFYTQFRVDEAFPFNLKSLNARLEALGWNSRTELKKRGLEETADDIRKKLVLQKVERSKDFGVIILARIKQGHFCFLAQRV